jgi:hypothetical protein
MIFLNAAKQLAASLFFKETAQLFLLKTSIHVKIYLVPKLLPDMS